MVVHLKRVLVLGVAIFVAWFLVTALLRYWFLPEPNFILGDLDDRYREFHFFIQGLNPKLQDPELGYPSWSYLIAGIWAFSNDFEVAKWLFFILQIGLVAIVGHDLFLRLRLKLEGFGFVILSLASCPIFIVADLARWGNYGLIMASCFYFSMLGDGFLIRCLSLVFSVLKPQTGLVLWISAFWRREWRIVLCASSVVFVLLIATSFVLGESPILSFFETMGGGFGNRLDNFYSTGNYGMFSNFVQSGLISPRVAVALCYLLYAILFGVVCSLVFSPIARYAFASALFPLFSYHRTHDLVLIWPVLVVVVATSFPMRGWKGWFWLLPVAWSLTFRENQPIPSLLFLAIVAIWWFFVYEDPIQSRRSGVAWPG